MYKFCRILVLLYKDTSCFFNILFISQQIINAENEQKRVGQTIHGSWSIISDFSCLFISVGKTRSNRMRSKNGLNGRRGVLIIIKSCQRNRL